MWPVLSNGIPISLPPFLPPSMALFFTLIYLPLLLLAMLNSAAPDIVMKSTPRKNIYQTRDRYRFVLYLLIRSFYISVSVFIVGWFAAASVNTHYLDPNSWDHAMDTFMPIFTSSNNTTDYLPSFYLIQDIMSCQQLLCIITQLFTLLKRGQSYRFLPTPFTHTWFYIATCICLIIHLAVLAVRQYTRQESNTTIGYQDLGWQVWIIMALTNIVSIFVGLVCNAHDEKSYRRYLMFLKLEFETKLGMHSPR